MNIEQEKNIEYANKIASDIKKELNNLKNEVIETDTPLKVYEVKNISDVWFGKSSTCSTGQDNLHFAVNWPLVGVDWKPVGWFIDNGTKQKDYIEPSVWGWNFSVDNWVFWVDKNWIPHLIPYAEAKNNSTDFQRAFQNWPMLIQNWKNLRENWTSTSKFKRSGIWFTPSWEAMVIYSETPVTFKEFAQLFVDQWCDNAIYLDWWDVYAWYADASGSYWNLNPSATKLQFFHQN